MQPANPQRHNTQQLAAEGAYTDTRRLLQLRFAAKDLKLFSQKPSRSVLNGRARTRFRGRGMEFEEVRIYQPGDDVRNIDWGVTARTQIPHTKLFREEKERPTLIVIDQRASLFFGSRRCFKSVLAAHIGSMIAWAALQHSDRVGGLVFGDHTHKDIRPKRSKHAVLELLNALNDFNHLLKSPTPTTTQSTKLISTQQLFEDTRRLAKPGTAVFIVSDFQDFSEACEEQLYLLVRHCDVSLFKVHDPLEQAINYPGSLSITDGQQRLQLMGGDKRFNQKLQQHFAAQTNHLKSVCQKLSISFYEHSTNDNEVQQMRQFFRK